MPEPLAERLSRFTPDGTGLDRDALLFAAGRASVRPRRAWPLLAALLAASQVLTLALLWPRPSPPASVVVTPASAPQVTARPDAPRADPSEVGALNQGTIRAGANDLPPATYVDGLVPDAPPLPAVTTRLPAGLE
jgi:hypothetical protein